MNSAKTEFVIFGSRHHLSKCDINHLQVSDAAVERGNSFKYLGVWMDDHLSFKKHITAKCKVAMYNIQRIKHIREYLTQEACAVLVSSLVLSHLDYANSLLFGLPDCDILRLQRVQNAAAKLILRKERRDSATACLKELHWLPIRLRINHKILTIIFKCLKGLAPKYLQNLINKKTPSRTGLRSENPHQLSEPRTLKKTFAARSFSVAGPVIWNNLPDNVVQATDVNDFKQKLNSFV